MPATHITVSVQKHPHLFRGIFVVFEENKGIFVDPEKPSKSRLLYHFFHLPLFSPQFSCPGNLYDPSFFNLWKRIRAPRDHRDNPVITIIIDCLVLITNCREAELDIKIFGSHTCSMR